MYLPYVQCVAQEDRLGNLQIWQGINHMKPEHDDQIAYIQTSQDREAIFEWCFDLTENSIREIEAGWPTIILLHEEMLENILS